MSKLAERENRRKSIVGSMLDSQPEKAERERKKRVSLSIRPSVYEDIQRIAYVQRKSVSDLMDSLMEKYRAEHPEELEEYKKLRED